MRKGSGGGLSLGAGSGSGGGQSAAPNRLPHDTKLNSWAVVKVRAMIFFNGAFVALGAVVV